LRQVVTTEPPSIITEPLANRIDTHGGAVADGSIRLGRWDDILELELLEDWELCVSSTAMLLRAKEITQSVFWTASRRSEGAQARAEEARETVSFSRLRRLPSRDQDVLKVSSSMKTRCPTRTRPYRSSPPATRWALFHLNRATSRGPISYIAST
ncbi:hypothetical protein LZ30DRAFT_609168, partial [Colletotrichum cereale]